jgi:hypothetical protein
LLPQLQVLSLGIMSLDAPSLLTALSEHAPKLRSLEVWKVTMLRPAAGGPYEPIVLFDDGKELAARKPLWAKFCEKLAEMPNFQPDHIMLGHIGDDPEGRGWELRVLLGELEKDRTVMYTGNDVRRFVKETVPRMKYSGESIRQLCANQPEETPTPESPHILDDDSDALEAALAMEEDGE